MRILLVILILLSPALASATTPAVGQSVLYRYDSTHSYVATVSAIEGDGSADLVVYTFGSAFVFGLSSQYAFATTYVGGVVEGTTDNRWAVNPSIGLGATGPAGAGSVVTSTSTASLLTLNGSATACDATHDCEYAASVKITTTLSLTGGSAGHVDLICGGVTVETVSGENTGTLTIGLALQTSATQLLAHRIPAGVTCRLATTNDTGTPTYTLVRQVAQPLG